MPRSRSMVQRSRGPRHHAGAADPQAARTLRVVAGDDATVVLLGLEDLGHQCWAGLVHAGVRMVRVADVAGALRAMREAAAEVVIADASYGRALTAAMRRSREPASAYVLLCAALGSQDEREALDAGPDDVMRVPFEPEVLAARVAAGLGAARLRANETLLRSLVANIPGAVDRCSCDENWTMEWLTDEIERISGYPAVDVEVGDDGVGGASIAPGSGLQGLATASLR